MGDQILQREEVLGVSGFLLEGDAGPQKAPLQAQPQPFGTVSNHLGLRTPQPCPAQQQKCPRGLSSRTLSSRCFSGLSSTGGKEGKPSQTPSLLPQAPPLTVISGLSVVSPLFLTAGKLALTTNSSASSHAAPQCPRHPRALTTPPHTPWAPPRGSAPLSPSHTADPHPSRNNHPNSQTLRG